MQVIAISAFYDFLCHFQKQLIVEITRSLLHDRKTCFYISCRNLKIVNSQNEIRFNILN